MVAIFLIESMKCRSGLELFSFIFLIMLFNSESVIERRRNSESGASMKITSMSQNASTSSRQSTVCYISTFRFQGKLYCVC